MKNFLIKIITILICILLFLGGCSKTETPNNEILNSEQSEEVNKPSIEPETPAPSVDAEIPDVNVTTKDESKDPEISKPQKDKGTKVEAEKVEKKEGKANGIDVSKWNGKIDWQKVASSGVDFAIIRIGYRDGDGKIYKDDNADYNIQQATKYKIPIGVYFFSSAKNKKEAALEASWCIKAIEGYKISYPVVYDCEGYNNSGNRMYNVTAKERTDNALEFLRAIKNAGYEGMFYNSKYELENSASWETNRLEKEFKIWVAHYSEPTYPKAQTPDYSGKYDMWQYTNCGAVKGVNGDCDLIVSYFTRKMAKEKDPSKTPQNAAPPKTEEELKYTEVSDKVTAKDSVNLRSGAGTEYEIVGTLKSGEFLERKAIGSNGWSKLIFKGKTVYAITSFLTDKVIESQETDIVNGAEFKKADDKVTAKEEVNLREEPTTDSKIVGKLSSGTFLKRTAIGSNGWSRLDYNGKTVYAITSYLTDKVIEKPQSSVEATETFTEFGMEFVKASGKFTAKEETNLRDKPSTEDSKIVYTLKNGEYAEKIADSNMGWSKLRYKGKTVYAVTSFLTK